MSINGVTNRDLYILAGGATGAAINRASNAEEAKQYMLYAGGMMALPTALKIGKAAVWDLPQWVIQNRGNYAPALQNTWNNTIGLTNAYAVNRNALKGNFWNTVGTTATRTQINALNVPQFDLKSLQRQQRHLNRVNHVLQPKVTDSFLTKTTKTARRAYNNFAMTGNTNNLVKADIYKDVNRLVAESKNLSGTALTQKSKEIEKALVEAKVNVNKAKANGQIVSKTYAGKAASWVKTKTGLRTVENKVLEATLSNNPVTRTLAKGAKAGGGMAVISLALETPNVVKTYKTLGGKKGTKQLGKSLVKVGAETAGYVVGAKLGAKLGATIGTFIGGPVGTAIGGTIGSIIGVGCGLLGSWLGGKAARTVVGKDELEIAKENETRELALAAQNNQELQIQLAQAAREKLEAGEVASEEDATSIMNSYNKLADAITSQTSSATISQTNTSQNFTTGYQRVQGGGLQALNALASNNYSLYNPFSFNSCMNNPFMSNPYMNNFSYVA